MTPGKVRVHRDAEFLVKEHVKGELARRGEDATVGIGLPDHWTPADGEHIQIEADGAIDQWPIAGRFTIRITAWSAGSTEAKRIANLVRGILLSTADTANGVHRGRHGAPVITTRDSRTGAQLASGTVLVPVRTALA